MKTRFFFFAAILTTTFFVACSKDDVVAPTAYDLADAQKGGMMFDAFWNTDAGSTLDAATVAKLDAAPNFFKCKACHGPEYNGSAGKYINRMPLTAVGTTPAKARPSVVSFSLQTLGQEDAPQDIFDDIKKSSGRRSLSADLTVYDAIAGSEGDKMPDYSALLTDVQIWDLVKFIKTQAIDVSTLYTQTVVGGYASTSTYSVDAATLGLGGNATNGKAYYDKNCKACHGADGMLEPGSTTFKGVGFYVRNEPYNIFNVTRFGRFNGGTHTLKMPGFAATDQDLKDLYRACADVTVFPN